MVKFRASFIRQDSFKKMYSIKKKSNEWSYNLYLIICASFFYLFINLSSKNIPQVSFSNIKYDTFFMCFGSINGRFGKRDHESCVGHKEFADFLPCHLGIDPIRAKKPNILILGSSGLIGSAFKKLLDSNHENYIEIRSRYHFNLQDNTVYEVFKRINISIVVDLVNNSEDVHNRVLEHFQNQGIPLIRAMREYNPNFHSYQIVFPKIIGSEYFTPVSSSVFLSLFHSIMNRSIPILPSMQFCTNHDAAKSIYHSIKNTNLTSTPPPTRVESNCSVYTTDDLLSTYNHYISNDWKNYSSSIMQILYDIEISQRKDNRIYASVFFTLTSNNDRVSKFLTTLELYSKIFKTYPDISLSIIVLYILPSTPIKRPDFPPYIMPYLEFYEVPAETYQNIINTMSTTYMPEYFFRNIGARLCKSDYYFSSTSDYFPSPIFVQKILKKAFSPFEILRPSREEHPYVNLDQYFDSIYVKREFTYKSQFEMNNANRYSVLHGFASGSTGDIQGGSIHLIYYIRGWINGKYTYWTDTQFIFDVLSLIVPPIITDHPGGKHLNHPTNYASPHFILHNDNAYQRKVCSGILSRDISPFERIDWGIGYSNGSVSLSFEFKYYTVLIKK